MDGPVIAFIRLPDREGPDACLNESADPPRGKGERSSEFKSTADPLAPSGSVTEARTRPVD